MCRHGRAPGCAPPRHASTWATAALPPRAATHPRRTGSCRSNGRERVPPSAPPPRAAAKKKAATRPAAARADKYRLYQTAVQDPGGDVARVRRMFERFWKHPPQLLREDFCGTAAFACAWVAAHGTHRAIGVDLDPEPLRWGHTHNIAKLSPPQQRRVRLLEGDVCSVRTEPVDLVVAFNFSYFLLTQRATLRRYFERVRESLAAPGLFVIDVYGGPEAQERREERRRVGNFTYIWDQYTFNPIDHTARCYMHFEFRDGSRLHRAYGYEWRLWSVPELRDLLTEVGFGQTTVYWEGTESGTNEPNGVFRPRERAGDDPAWVAYIAARP